MKNTKELIEEVHNEFYSAGEALLQEAKAVIEKTPKQVMEKGGRLKSIGFFNTAEVKSSNITEQKIREMELISQYSVKYPNNRFITLELVQKILEKYNLIKAPISYYTGFVPEEKLKIIEEFRLELGDLDQQDWVMASLLYDSSREYVKNKKIKCRNLEICAPQKDIIIDGLEQNGRVFSDKQIPDPVVLQPVIGGYLIVAAWGDEASDPDIVNEKHN